MQGQGYLENFIDRTVDLQEFRREVDLDLKISALILALEKLQRIRRSKQEPLRFEEFEQCGLFVDIDKLVLVAPKTFKDLGSGTRPIQLQAPLLLFLLLHHGDQ